MSTKSVRSRALAHPMLELDWEHRTLDDLVHGLSRLSVPVAGGTDSRWALLVTELQWCSAADSTAPDAFHLVSAERTGTAGTLELGVRTWCSDAASLRTRLALAISYANGTGMPALPPRRLLSELGTNLATQAMPA